ncbi:MAG: hypothetical protein IIY21_13720 [Clostridiales bacterium]|nr:hypothetical protein [Clostridiales bacterium]MBQ1571353.1 hypothetical protein [Clostridiales bacterium]
MNVAMVFIDALEDIYEACASIQDAGGCDKCPIKHNCLDDTSVAEFANFCTRGSLEEFMGFAEDVENYANEQDMADYHEWMKR